MGSQAHTIHIDINHSRPDSIPPSPSVLDEEEDGVHVSEEEISPNYSELHAPSQSGSSGEHFILTYPHEAAESEIGDRELATRLISRSRHSAATSRSNSMRRVSSQPAPVPEEPPRSRPQGTPTSSTTDDADSAEEFLQRREYAHHRMPRPTTYYDRGGGYTHSSSSGSYTYPPVPHHHQIVHYQPQPQPPPMPYQYPHPASPPPGFPPSHHGYHPAMSQHPGSHMSAPYPQSMYGPQSVMQYGAPPSGYFTPQYPPPSQYGQFPPQYMQQMQQWQQMPQQIPPPMSPQLYYQNSEPPRQQQSQPPPAASPPPPEPKVDEESIMKKMQALLLAERDERDRKELERQREIQSAEDKHAAFMKAEAERQAEQEKMRRDARIAAEEEQAALRRRDAERREEERRIREEARREALEAEKARIAAEEERAAYEQKIRREAAEAALAAAAADAAAKKEQAEREAKIAADAAEAAKTAAEKDAAAAAATAEADAKKASEEAEAKLKEATEAAEAAKKEAEAAEAAAKAAAPPDKKAPLKFRDALGRNYNFPWDRCYRWQDMESLIHQAFAHIKDIGPHVLDGHYDLIGADKEIIMPEYWEESISPGMQITMMLWPMPEPEPEPEPEPVPPPADEDVIDIEALLAGKIPKKRSSDKGKKGKPGGFSSWMLGGAPGRSKPALKGDKRPEAAAGSQHGTTDQGACVVM